jgi:serine/threonine protein kinase
MKSHEVGGRRRRGFDVRGFATLFSHLEFSLDQTQRGTLARFPMTKLQDAPRPEELSEPEISVGGFIQARVEEFKGNIIGERFGKYLLVGEIAVGGMAEVFLAVHKGVEGFIKVVVIKRVLPHLTKNPEFMRMFIEEARLAARLEHPNIVRTYEFGEVDGHYYTAMEYLPGEDLFKALNNLSMSRQQMPVHIAAGITSQLCSGLHFAHQFTDTGGRPLNLVHRDINPANIIITYGGEVKIIDFGVAKSNTNAQTLSGMIKGKVAYMPPEQLLGREVDQRADIFSAGVVMWEMLTGRPLFLRSSEAATLYAIMNAPVAPPSRFRHDVPPALDRIVARALARSPAERFATAEEMASAIDEFLIRVPRYDARVLGGKLEELFGSTRAEAKRSIAQTRSLTRNISLVMKLRSEVRAELAERLDAAVDARRVAQDDEDDAGREIAALPSAAEGGPAARGSSHPIQAVEPSRSQRGLVIALAVLMVAAIGAGLGYTLSRSQPPPMVRQASASALRIESTPPGAAVFVGGEPTGLKTPATLTGIARTQLAIRLELLHHAPVARTIDIPAGKTASVQMTLEPLQGRLVISDLPPNAGVIIDTEEYQAGDVIPVAAGSHEVRIVLAGRTLTRQSIETASGDQGWKFVRDKLVRN